MFPFLQAPPDPLCILSTYRHGDVLPIVCFSYSVSKDDGENVSEGEVDSVMCAAFLKRRNSLFFFLFPVCFGCYGGGSFVRFGGFVY